MKQFDEVNITLYCVILYFVIFADFHQMQILYLALFVSIFVVVLHSCRDSWLVETLPIIQLICSLSPSALVLVAKDHSTALHSALYSYPAFVIAEPE